MNLQEVVNKISLNSIAAETKLKILGNFYTFLELVHWNAEQEISSEMVEIMQSSAF